MAASLSTQLGRLQLIATIGPFFVVLALFLAPGVEAGERIDRLLVDKSERRLSLLAGGEVLYSFPVALGANPVGHKVQEGDERTPEGIYSIDYRNPDSRFHRALHISYPNAEDRARAARKGIDPGGMIMIHGIGSRLGWVGVLHRWLDWTDGCIAVTDSEMDTIWEVVEIGTPIEIVP